MATKELIVVTGATGHLGANLCPLLLEQGYRVRGLHRNPQSARTLQGLNMELMRGDIGDGDFLRQAFNGAAAVVHLAARISVQGDKDGSLQRINVTGVERVAHACLDLGIRLIHISSIHMFDLYHTPGVLNESSALAAADAFDYDLSKRAGFERVKEAMEQGLNATVLCPVGILGPRDYEPSLMGHFFRNLYKGSLPAVVTGGFYWADVRDNAQAISVALKRPTPGEVYLLGGHYATISELVVLASQVTQRNLNRPVLSYSLALLGLPFLKLYSSLRSVAPLYTYQSLRVLRTSLSELDDTKARTQLGYNLRPLRDTVRDTYSWHLQQGL